jgi:predicted component of type VI protein secretion system
MILCLRHQRPDGETDQYHLKPGRPYHLGRGSACQIRILDLKLSRIHAVVSYDDGEWRVHDQSSTNGCTVDGDLIAGSAILRPGMRIDLGQTSLTVVSILDTDEIPDDDETAPAATAIEPATTFTARPPAPLGRSERIATPQPEDQDEPPRSALALSGSVPPPAAGPPPPAPAQPPTEYVEEQSVHITVLGRRVGPLTRSVARDLKARELRGQLTAADLDALG